jgi:putative endonuclease
VGIGEWRKRMGGQGEAAADRYLRSHGYTILAHNWRTRAGEIDLVAEREGVLVFVEVKARTSHQFGRPEEAVTPAKRRRLIRTAQAYLQSRGTEDAAWRVDVIALDLDRSGGVLRLDHYQDAVDNAP